MLVDRQMPKPDDVGGEAWERQGQVMRHGRQLQVVLGCLGCSSAWDMHDACCFLDMLATCTCMGRVWR